jgi:hypothetical protein
VQELVGEKLHPLLLGVVPDIVTNAVTLLCTVAASLSLHWICQVFLAVIERIFQSIKRVVTN